MPRHKDKRVRLVRIERWPGALDKGVRLTSGPRFESACTCGLPTCTWTPAKQRAAERDYKARRGSWQTADGRFVLRWVSSRSAPTRAHPHGPLQLTDTRSAGAVSWHTSMSEARRAIVRTLEREARERVLRAAQELETASERVRRQAAEEQAAVQRRAAKTNTKWNEQRRRRR